MNGIITRKEGCIVPFNPSICVKNSNIGCYFLVGGRKKICNNMYVIFTCCALCKCFQTPSTPGPAVHCVNASKHLLLHHLLIQAMPWNNLIEEIYIISPIVEASYEINGYSVIYLYFFLHHSCSKSCEGKLCL